MTCNTVPLNDPETVDAVVPAGRASPVPLGLGLVPATEGKDTLSALTFDEPTVSKNEAFFYGANQPTVTKPPPPLKIQTFNPQIRQHEDPQTLNFADRIRAIVAENRKNSPATTSTPVSATRIKQTISNFIKKFNMTEKVEVPKDQIMPLPSPSEPSIDESFARHEVLSPEQLDSAIPLVSLSPDFVSDKTNIVPSVKDEPILGDLDNDLDNEIAREVKFPSPDIGNDATLKGKHIWKFRTKEVLGTGAFATVYLAENLEEGGHVAIKTLNKERMRNDLRMKSSVEREVGLLKHLKHERIVQLEATMETEQHMCLVLEYVKGGELFSFVKHMHRIGSGWDASNEIVIKKLVLELIEVVSWLHDHNIVHRDIKLENILVYFDPATNEPHIKLTDFGLARVIDPNDPKLVTRCGSIEYVAPEVVALNGYDGRLSDTWSVGVVIFAMLTGYLPFTYDEKSGETITHLYRRIMNGRLQWPRGDGISISAQLVVGRLLSSEKNRISLKEVVKLSWFEDT